MAIVALLVSLFYLAVLFCIGYLVIKKAVKDAIIEAHEELDKKNAPVKYINPVVIGTLMITGWEFMIQYFWY